ncbi:MAG: TonB-dependent receptor plug domain-containing protein [Bacteroidetes bacterium]|nr:TonB-dependent receptor plug domain-containing protein [Bacteroidota bacterium]
MTIAFNAQTTSVNGVVKGLDGEPLPNIIVYEQGNEKNSFETDTTGEYRLTIPANNTVTLVFYSVNFDKYSKQLVTSTKPIYLSPVLNFKNQLTEVEVQDLSSRGGSSTYLEPKNFNQLPTLTGNVEDLIKTQIGVSSNNELSSGYSVRGGNFDENLIYVNDIEVYRPFLVRSGQQEGLSFANPAMVQKINFSSGGFEAKYGDKLSSVLDITYKRPLKTGGSASASFLGGNIQLEGISKNRLVAYTIGARYRTLSYILQTFDTKGEYRPNAGDIQSFVTFKVNPKFSVEWLTNIASNRYLVIPASRQTNFGTAKQALRFTVYFDGQELMSYLTGMTGVSAIYKPTAKTQLKFITSAYHAREQELFTVQGQYYIDELEADFGKPTFGQVAFNRGVGTFINNGRNYLSSTVANFEHKGTHQINNKSQFLWGARAQQEIINDRLSEWKTVDSAGYILPYSPNVITLEDVYKTKITLQSQRFQGYAQYNLQKLLSDSSEIVLTAGARANYWTLNNQLVASPRVTFAIRPNWKRDWLFKISSGIYYQPPFYRELRNIDGTVVTNLKAQQSIHFVLTSDYNFKMWNRPFKLIMAGYYKQLNQLIPYEVDNVRIRYFANNNAKGYVVGSDVRINGEFVPGVESWATLGLLRTYEKSPDNIHYLYYNKAGEEIIKGFTFDQVKTDSVKVDPGFIPRPTDQLVTFGLFFQDYLPKRPQFKFNLNLQFGSGLPFGPPTHKRWEQIKRMPPYRRVDAGFAYNILKSNREIKRKNAFNNLKEMWVFLEVFNLLQIQNTVSYIWVTDVTGNRYAIPNYLTNRQINLRLQISF